MLYFQGWKLALIIGVCLLGFLFALPNAFAPATLAQWPSFLRHQVSLGLDLRGGSHLLLEVDMNVVEQERLNSLVDEARTQLVAAKIGYSDLAATANHVSFTVRDASRMNDVRGIVNKLDPGMDVQIGASGIVTLTPNQQALIQRRNSAIDQSIEIVRRRIDETGTKEPTIQREGEDRILVQLPGVENPEHVKEILGKTAKMTFQLVDPNASPQDARSGRLPPGDVLLPSDTTANGQPTQYYVVRRRVMVSGDTLTDAQATFQNSAPVVSFKFDFDRRAALRRRDERECRQALCHRARQQGDQRAGDPRADPRRLGRDRGQLHRADGERSVAAAARRRFAGAVDRARRAHRRPRSRRRFRSMPARSPASSVWPWSSSSWSCSTAFSESSPTSRCSSIFASCWGR